MTKEVNSKGMAKELVLKGNVDIYHAQELKDEIQRILQETDQLWIDLSEASDIDLASVQVIYAAQKTAAQQAKQLTTTGALSEPVRAQLTAGGFLRPDGREFDSCQIHLWDGEQ